jgi:hypothetical protein
MAVLTRMQRAKNNIMGESAETIHQSKKKNRTQSTQTKMNRIPGEIIVEVQTTAQAFASLFASFLFKCAMFAILFSFIYFNIRA